MIKKTINLGVQPNDNTGDNVRVAFQKTNENFDYLFDTTNQILFELGSTSSFLNTSTLHVGISDYAVTADTALKSAGLLGGNVGRIPIQSAVGTTTFIPAGSTSGQVLTWIGSTAIWSLNASSTTATNLTGGSAGRIPIQSTTGTTSFIPVGTSGQLLQAGTNTATFVSTSSLHVGAANFAISATNSVNSVNAIQATSAIDATNAQNSINSTFAALATTATNLTGGSVGRIPIQSGAGTTSFIASGSPGELLQAGTNTATFVSTSSLHVGLASLAALAANADNSTNATNATNASNIFGGAAGRILIQSGAGTTSFIASGSPGELLQAGTNTATFVSTSSLHVGISSLSLNSQFASSSTFAATAGVATNALTANLATTATFALSANTAFSAVNADTATQAENLNLSNLYQVSGLVSSGVIEATTIGPATTGAIRIREGSSNIGYLQFVNSNGTVERAFLAVSAAGTGTWSTSFSIQNNLTVNGNSILGSNSNVKITGGSNGQFLRTDGSGNLTWATVVTDVTINNGTGITGGGTGSAFTLGVTNPVLRHVSGGYTSGGQVFVSASAPTASAVGDIWIEI